MTRSLRSLIVLTAVTLASCSHDAMVARILPAGADQRARAYLSLFVRGEVDSAAARLVPELQSPAARAQLDEIAVVLRGRPIDSLQVIGVQVNSLPDMRHVNISYELGDARGWAVASVAVRESGSDWAVEGVTAQTTAGSLKALNRFRLAGQPMGKYVWLLAMIVAAGASVAAAVAVARTRGMPKRWWWVVVALIGVVRFSLDWTTGQWELRPVQFMLLSAGFMKAGPVAPWILSFALPVGAAIALWRRRRWRRGLERPSAEPSSPTSARAVV